MKIILRKDVDRLGRHGEVVDVAVGYARNYLLPRGLAYEATPGNLRRVEEEKHLVSQRVVKEREEATALAQRLGSVSLTFVMRAGEEDQLYGSVSAQEIAEKLTEQGYAIDKKNVQLEEPIKALGVYTVDVKLHPEVTGKVKVWVVKE